MAPPVATIPLPPPLVADLGKHVGTEVGIGESEASVYRYARDGRPTVYLKSRRIGGTRPRALFDEAERLGWMQAVGLPVASVLQYHEWKGHEYLVTSALPGVPAADPRPSTEHRAVVSALAAGLRLLHGTNISACPFDQSRRLRMADATARLSAGEVREFDFDPARQGRSGASLHAELVQSVPSVEDRVFTHGDFCLPNVLLEPDGRGGLRVSGFVDCGSAGVADPYQDLALCARSIGQNLGDDLVPELFRAYGIATADETRVHFYQLLDEFF